MRCDMERSQFRFCTLKMYKAHGTVPRDIIGTLRIIMEQHLELLSTQRR